VKLGVSPARYTGDMTAALDPATLRAIIARVEHQLAELDRRSGHCALCRSADLKMHLGWLRGLLAWRTGTGGLDGAPGR
jgi:hypothetical protein